MEVDRIRNYRHLFRALRRAMAIQEDSAGLLKDDPAVEAAFVRRMSEGAPCACGYTVDPCDKFCGHCGSQNPKFTEFDCMMEYNHPVERELEKCRDGHREEQSDILHGDRAIYVMYPYCHFCGKRVFSEVPPQTAQ